MSLPRSRLGRCASDRVAVRTALVLALLASSSAAQNEETVAFDLLLRGGTVLDGTRDAEPRTADVAIRGRRIVAIGDLSDRVHRAGRTLDCSGLVVAPGFIDVHAHADLSAARRGDARNFVAMGVASIITGNCGTSVKDLEAHLAEVERRGIAINYGSLVGHGTVRSQVMGRANRAPTEEELGAMKALVQRGLEAGAFGMSTGLIYVPGTYSETAELIALCEPVAAADALYVSHMRGEGSRVLRSIAEALEIGKTAGCAVHLSHLKASGKPNWGRSVEILEALEAARAAGVRVTGDQYAYAASSTSLDVLFPSDALSVGRRKFGEQLRDDEEFREAMHAALRRSMERSGFGDLSYAQIATAPGHADLSGKRISAAAEHLFGAADPDAQARCAIQLMIDARGRRISMVYHKMSEDDVERLMRVPFLAVASDSGIRMYETSSKPHPRGAGNNPRVLGRYVRERDVLPLALAIHKMTGLPAEIFGLEDRGVLRAGAFADVVVFDPNTVLDRATYEEPLQTPEGFAHLIVSGSLVLEDGKRGDARPGMILRKERP